MMDKIRQVRKEDLYAIIEIEAICFPAAEAADKKSIASRIDTFPESFFVAEKDDRIVGFINGAVTNERTIRDEMFEDAGLHINDGAYQSIFGLDVIPEYQHQGIAGRLMRHLINDAMIKGRKGLILTCKEHLIGFYEQFGFSSLGLSESVHGGAVWYDMILFI
ncbi:GNAT family N-acetyltransferase [Vallitalea guaymasensis]|uniref:GNAT family N-acetyltransferase n=1 Tax=Vallitalea guaymasensis TaxID=1185412 RepID=UPI000DE56F80|nr:GNAT family N-acetyltransferase [Vallitalea guaymasensis]